MKNRSRAHGAWIAGLAALALAGTASADDASANGSVPRSAAEVVKVRVGNHPTYTRVVFELDASAGYRVEKLQAPGGGSEIRVTLEASAPAIQVDRKTVMVERVALEQGSGRSVAHIRLHKTPSRLKEMILANPPRIVFDLVFPEQQLAAIRRAEQQKAAAEAKSAGQVAERKPGAAASEPTPPAKKPEPSTLARAEKRPTPAVKPEAPTPAPLAKAEVPKPAPSLKPAQPTPAPLAKAEAPKPMPSVKPEAPKPSPLLKPEAPKPLARAEAPKPSPSLKPEAPKPMPSLTPEAPAPGSAAKPELAKMPPAPPEPGKAASEAKPGAVVATREEPGAGQPSDARQAAERAAPAPPAARPAPAPKPPTAKPADATAARPQAAPGLLGGIDVVLWGSVAAGAILLVLVVVLVMRRRSLPNDMDVTAVAEEHAGEGAIPGGGFAMDTREDEGGAPLDAATVADSFTSGASAPRSEPRSAGVDIAAGPGLFDEEEPEKESETMDAERTGMDHTASEMPTQLGGAAGGADMARLVRDLERRMAQLETRLDESTEARERLERQVAAQAEELRVQRAAIARTQRALRSLNRPAEEQATEPALRDQS